MSLFQKPNPRNLNEWLQIATRELVAPAERRIWAEVTSHYEEAVEGHLQNGLPIALAQAAALAELGDAKAAGRRFRRTHLTVLDFEKVHKLLGSCQPSLWVEFAGFYLCFCFGVALWRRFSFSPLIGMVALFILYETVARMLSRRKSARRVVQMELGAWLMMGISYFCSFHTIRPHGWTGPFWVLNYLIAIANILYCFRLNNKLGKGAGDWMGESIATRKEIPPDKPVAS
jgi:hypothetical protein